MDPRKDHMDILPSSPTPEAALTARIGNTVPDPALYATRAVALVRQVSRLHHRVLKGQATSRRDTLFVTRRHQADAMLAPFGLTVYPHATGCGIATLDSVKSPAPVVLWEVSP